MSKCNVYDEAVVLHVRRNGEEKEVLFTELKDEDVVLDADGKVAFTCDCNKYMSGYSLYERWFVYVSSTRTNYFRVTDEAAFKSLMSRVAVEKSLMLWENEADEKKFGFAISGAFNLLASIDSDLEDLNEFLEADMLYSELQPLLPDGEAAIITTIGKENLKYLFGEVVVVTNKEIRRMNLYDTGISIAREMIGNPHWETKNEY